MTLIALVCSTTKLQIGAYCQPAIFQDLRFGIKFIFSSTREVIEKIEGLHSNYDFCLQNFPIFLLTFMNGHILDQI